MPLLRNTGAWNREALYWHYPHYHPGGAKPYGAIRQGDWKLIRFYEDNHTELYNLRRDPEEKTDLAKLDTGKANDLNRRLEAWLKETSAQAPVSNPGYDPAKTDQTRR